MRLCRLVKPGSGTRLGIEADGEVKDLTAVEPVIFGSVAGFLGWSTRNPNLAMSLAPYIAAAPIVCSWDDLVRSPAAGPRLLRPTDGQEVWAAGVTYERSRLAREEESAGATIYDRVYAADRPELFFKATPGRTVGPGEPVRVRSDSRWTAPEPELALLVNPALQIVGYTLANDVTARDLEAANPLYLPQAKIWDGCCALGPAVLLADGAPPAAAIAIRCRVLRAGAVIFEGHAPISRLRRGLNDLVAYLGRDNSFVDGVVLLTGTGIVPPDELALSDGDVVEISAPEIGLLSNPVQRR